MIKVTYKEEFSYDDPRIIEFNTYEDFGIWYTRIWKDIKIIRIVEER